jgi:hypothetical protein
MHGTAAAPKKLKNIRVHKAPKWDRDVDDYYVEEDWCSARLFEQEHFQGSILDPACGSGRIVNNARLAGYQAFGTDLKIRSKFCMQAIDFMLPTPLPKSYFQNIVCNPPFRIAIEFLKLALERYQSKMAIILPLSYLAGDQRTRWLENSELRRVLVFTPRPSMPPGLLVEQGFEAGGGKPDYAFYVFEKGYCGNPELGWVRRDP